MDTFESLLYPSYLCVFYANIPHLRSMPKASFRLSNLSLFLSDNLYLLLGMWWSYDFDRRLLSFE